MDKATYFSVGELSQRAGVTVRTVQYYDQEGLLVPSAKGPNNQRLYTEQNAKDLYRILFLKYLGLPLAQIKSEMAQFDDNRVLHSIATQQLERIEEDFQHLFKRLATIRLLLEKTNENADEEVDWELMVRTVEDSEEGEFFWNLTSIHDDDRQSTVSDAHSERNAWISKWHELIADTLKLLANDEPLTSKDNQKLAERYLELDTSQQTLTVNQNFILMENIVPNKHMGGSFNALRDTVCGHLEAVLAANNELNGLAD